MNVEFPNEDHFFSFAESALHYVTRQDSLLIKAPATNIIKTSWDLFFFSTVTLEHCLANLTEQYF